MSHPLDRAVWNALTTRLSSLTTGDSDPRAVRIDPEVGVFLAAADGSSESRSRLTDLAHRHPGAGLVERADGPMADVLPDGVAVRSRIALVQMTATALTPASSPGVAFETLTEADAVKKLLATGASFEALAMERSTDAATRFNGGDLGYFTVDVMPEAYAGALKTAQKGQLIGPFATEGGWAILRVEDKRMEEPITLEAARPQIVRFLTYDQVRDLLEKLRGGAKVEMLTGKPQDVPGAPQEPASAPPGVSGPVSAVFSRRAASRASRASARAASSASRSAIRSTRRSGLAAVSGFLSAGRSGRGRAGSRAPNGMTSARPSAGLFFMGASALVRARPCHRIAGRFTRCALRKQIPPAGGGRAERRGLSMTSMATSTVAGMTAGVARVGGAGGMASAPAFDDDIAPAPFKAGMVRFRRLRVLFALVAREMATSYGKSYGGYFWAIAQPLGLSGLQRFGHLDQPHVGRVEKVRRHARGAQQVAHQRAVARAHLDQAERRGPAHAGPGLQRPDADKLAEHLADQRRGDEIAAGPQIGPGGVIAVARVVQAAGEELGNADRPVLGDLRLQTIKQAHARLRLDRLEQARAAPSTSASRRPARRA